MVLTTELILFFCVTLAGVVTIILYLGNLDRRITILETKTIDREELYKKIDEIKKAISDEIKTCQIRNVGNE
jgi:uncharacterized ion transporter superfamily protein YfcC